MVLIVRIAIKHVHSSKCFKIAWNYMKLSLLTDELAVGSLFTWGKTPRVTILTNKYHHIFFYRQLNL